MSTPINTILSWFETGDFPTQEQFEASWTSFRHKDESIPMDQVENLNSKLQEKVDKTVYNAHLTNEEAHITTLAKLNASNLNDANIQAWKTILGVGDLPPNIATVDDGTQLGNVYTKIQSDDNFIPFAGYTNDEGKILADMIEALGITDLIEAVETTIAAFAANSANYNFQNNDFIAIPNNGSYSLFMYKGGTKTVTTNYLPTGLTNITIAMVEGLQAALNAKMDKPNNTGSYFGNKSALGGQVAWRAINPSVAYLLFWNGNDFVASGIYTTGDKYGIGTTSPTEMIHLNDGRLRSKALVFDENTESLPNQITLWNRRFHGADLTGTRRMFMYRDYDDVHALFSGLTDTQKAQVRNDLRLTGEIYSTGQPRIDSVILPFIDNSYNFVQYITLIGLNLFVDNQTPTANLIMKRVKDVNGNLLSTPEVYNITNFNVLQTNPNTLNFGLNWNAYPEGYYQFFCTHNLLTNPSSPELLVKQGITFTTINPVWQDLTGSAAVDSNNNIVMGGAGSARTNVLIDTAQMVNGFVVKCSVSTGVTNNGANFPGGTRFTLKGDDGLEYGVTLTYNLDFYPNNVGGFTTNVDVIYISYYNGILTLTAEVNGKTKVFSVTSIPSTPRYFYANRSGGGVGSFSAKPTQLLLL